MRIRVELPGRVQELVLSPAAARRRLSEILRAENLPLNTRCGEKNLCAGCVIELVDGSLVNVDDGEVVSSAGDPLEIRGCRHRPASEEVALRVPQRALLAYAPQVLDDYRVNVPYARDPLVARGLGVAIDIGTTTVVVQILDPVSGAVIGKASGFNKQMHFGDDVLTRINLCGTDPEMLGRLHRAIVAQTLMPLLEEALGGRADDEVACFAIAGNTTMLHLLVGEDPTSMGFAPFTPSFLEREPFLAGSIGLSPTSAPVHLLPCVAAYIGADLTSGLFASGLLYDEGPSLLVDIGTNGEILLIHDGVVSGCATAAGPAFEGSGLSCGLRAGEGAIAHIWLEREPFAIGVEKIGPRHLRATGLCGSAYIDFLAEGRRVGLLSSPGRFQPPVGAEHTVTDTYGSALVVAHGQGKRPIVVTEADVGRLLQAKAAIAAGILTLLSRYGLVPADVRHLYLAGGFGMHLNLANAIACGLLPGFSVDQIQLVGNTSLAGATLALLDRNTLAELSKARQGVEIVELNLEPGFEDTYIDQLFLP